MMELFNQGGPLFMGILTVTLLGVLWTFWKGGALKELGLLALAVGVLGQLIGLYHAFSVLEGFQEAMGEAAGEGVIAGGLKVSLTPTLYGLMIYILSVVLRAVRTWRQA
jgi:biopolymer transport protein ExbB/TolQ